MSKADIELAEQLIVVSNAVLDLSQTVSEIVKLTADLRKRVEILESYHRRYGDDIL